MSHWFHPRVSRGPGFPIASMITVGALLLVGGSRLQARDGEPPLPALEAQLQAGEFGPAVDAAIALPDTALRTRYLKQISAAQRAAGEFEGAAATARHIPVREERAHVQGENVRQRNHAGGTTGANFAPLMDLITSTVEPDTWDEVGGPGSVRPFNTGVRVDPDGMLRQLSKEEGTGSLEAIGKKARFAAINEDMARKSGLRMVSLSRLERAVRARVEAGLPVLETMQRLAGLSEVRYVFAYPDEHDIVIAGPAETWVYDETGRPMGSRSGRPMLHLDDLVVVLRTFDAGGENLFGCSINPRDANMKDVKEFVEASTAAGPLKPGQLGRWLRELHSRLGVQDVVVHGVPANTRVAQTLVVADYRMKLIGVDKLDGGPNIPSYFDLLEKFGDNHGGSLEALRWWMTMKYSAILHSADRNFYEIQGSSVLIQSENQFINSQGQHIPTGMAEPLNRMFALNFTRHYQDLAKTDPVFADLQNIFDLGMVAALCQHERLGKRTGWDRGVFARNGGYRVAEVNAPTVVESVINHRVYAGKNIVVQVAGGVRADLLSVAKDKSLAKEGASLGAVGRKGKSLSVPVGRWWWDAVE